MQKTSNSLRNLEIMKYVSKHIDKNEIRKYKNQSYFFIEYDPNNKNFHELFIYQVISFANDSTKTKIDFLIKLIKMNCKPLHLSQFKKAIYRYLFVNLITSTINFYCNSDDISNKSSYYNIFNEGNLDRFFKFICLELDSIVKKNKPLIDENGLKNEFVTDEIMINFFKKVKYILNSLHLRMNYYTYANGNFSNNNERLSFNNGNSFSNTNSKSIQRIS